MARLAGLGVLLFLLAQAPACAQGGMEVDHGLYGMLLARHVQNGLVDYAGFKREEELLDRYLDLLSRVDPEGLSRAEQFAFYINAYNAWTIKLVLGRWPRVSSIKELGTWFRSPWKIPLARIAGGLLTLDEIEHGILRPRFADPRVHFAVNCASRGCPPLLAEPYLGARLEEQLERATADFLNDPARYRLEEPDFWVSSLFKWFAEDFPQGVPAFYLRFARGELRARLAAAGDRLRVRYLDWDWSLNAR